MGDGEEGEESGFQKFAGETSAEIAGYIHSAQNSRCELLYWISLALVFISLTVLQIISVTIKYISIPVGTEVVPLMNQSMRFPNMTLCFRMDTRSLMKWLTWVEAEPLLDELLAKPPCEDLLHQNCNWFEEDTECVMRSGCADSRRCDYAAAPYLGRKNSTIDGKPCIRWDSPGIQAKYRESWRVGQFKLGGHNHCRLTEESQKSVYGRRPWCFTSEADSDFCFPDCHTEESTAGKVSCVDERRDCVSLVDACFVTYRGKKTTTRSGAPCITWGMAYKDKFLPSDETGAKWGIGHHRYCRPAEGDPWCNTEGGGWDWCFYTCPPTVNDQDFHAPNPGNPTYYFSSLTSLGREARNRMLDKVEARFGAKSGKLGAFIQKTTEELCKLAGVDWYVRHSTAYGFVYANICRDGWRKGLYTVLSGRQVCFHLPTNTLPPPFATEKDELTLEIKLGRLFRDWKSYIKAINLRFGQTPLILEIREKSAGYISELGIRLEPGYRQNVMVHQYAAYKLYKRKHPECQDYEKASWEPEEECVERCRVSATRTVCGMHHCYPGTGKYLFRPEELNEGTVCSLSDYRNYCGTNESVASRIREEKLNCKQRCSYPCTRTQYGITLKETYNYDISASNKWVGANHKYSSINLWFGDFSYTVFQEVPLMPLQIYLSELGGSLGLYLGLSLLPFAHLFLFLARSCCCPPNREVSGRRKSSVVPQPRNSTPRDTY